MAKVHSSSNLLGSQISKSGFLSLNFIFLCLFALFQAYGPGLSTAETTEQAQFTVDAVKPGLVNSGHLSINVSGQSATYAPSTKITDNNDGTYKVVYTPAVAEEYDIVVKYQDNHIPGSPFSVAVVPKPDESKCIVKGACFGPYASLPAGEPLEFTVETANAGNGTLEVTATGPDGGDVPAFFNKTADTYRIRIDTVNPGEYIVTAMWSGVHISGSPFKLNVMEIIRAKQLKV